MALELLLDDVRVEDRLEVFSYAWQAAAALHVCYAVDRSPPTTADVPTDLPYPEEVIGAAVASGDEHDRQQRTQQRIFDRGGAAFVGYESLEILRHRRLRNGYALE